MRKLLLMLLACSIVTGGIPVHPGNIFQISTDSQIVYAANPAKLEPATRQSIQKGFAWLISTIRRDGTVGTDLYQGPDLGCTAIVGLAFLSEGSTPRGGTYSKESRRILYGVLDLVERRSLGRDAVSSTTLIQRKIGMNADLFLAALYLSEVYYEAPGAEEAIRSALDKLVAHISAAQGKDGTWGDESWAPILGTVLGWECLRSASAAGMQIDASATLVGQALLGKLKMQSNDEKSWMHSFYKDASSLRVLYSMNLRDDPIFEESVARLLKTAREDRRPFQFAGGEEYLAFFLVTECLLKEDRADWNGWYPRVSSEFIRTQNHDGSWTGHHCIVDRTFCTAAALLTLLAPNFSLSTSEL